MNTTGCLGDYMSASQRWVVTPNNDTIYGAGFANLGVEPAVIQTPTDSPKGHYWTIQIEDVFTNVVHQLGSASEQCQQFIYQAALRVLAGNDRLENVRVANPLDAAEHLLSVQAVNDCLHCGVGRPAGLRKSLLNLSNGTRAFLPKRLQHLQFQLCKPRFKHIDLPVDKFILL